MLQITNHAAERLKASLAKIDPPEDACFRIGVSNNKLRLGIDQERAGDAVIEHQGEVLVVMDPKAANRLYNRRLDYDESASSLVLKEAE